MNSPFRSELEQLQEQLRRTEERATTLAAEKAELEQMVRHPRSNGWITLAIVGMLVTGGLGFGASTLDAKREAGRARAVCERATSDAVNAEQLKALQCEVALARCRPFLPPAAPPPPPLRPGPAQPCACQPGDPLCSCL